MTWLLAIVIVLLIGGAFAVAAGWGSALGPAYDDRRDVEVPADRPLTGADLRGVRFTTVLRGYRPAEVDALLARLAAELDATASGPQASPPEE